MDLRLRQWNVNQSSQNQIIALQANMTTLKKCGENVEKNVEKMLLVRRVGPDKGGHWEIIG